MATFVCLKYRIPHFLRCFLYDLYKHESVLLITDISLYFKESIVMQSKLHKSKFNTFPLLDSAHKSVILNQYSQQILLKNNFFA